MAEEEKILDEKDLNMLIEIQKRIQEDIANAKLSIKNENDTATVTIEFGRPVVINVKKTKLLEDHYEFTSDDDSISGKITREKGHDKVDVDFNLTQKEIKLRLDEERRKKKEIEEKAQKGETKGDQEALKTQIEKGLIDGRVVELDFDREFSESENARMFFKRAFGEDVTKCYRVQGKDNHDFKYVAYTPSHEYKEIQASSLHEGSNPHQKIWVIEDVDKDGQGDFVEKDVDSLLIKGEFGIATDFPDDITAQNTTTYVVVRLPNGQYLGTPIGQKYGPNRNTSQDDQLKEDMARSKSKYQLEDIVNAADLAKKSEELLKDNKIQTDEIDFIRKLKMDNLSDRDVLTIIENRRIIEVLTKAGFEKDEIKEFIENSQSQSKDDKIKNAQIMIILKAGGCKYDDIKKFIEKSRNTIETGNAVIGEDDVPYSMHRDPYEGPEHTHKH